MSTTSTQQVNTLLCNGGTKKTWAGLIQIIKVLKDRIGLKRMDHSPGNEMNGRWTTTYRYHTWQQGSLPGTHRGEYSHFYTLKRGTPTSTASTRTTRAPEEQSSCTRSDTGHLDLLDIGRSYGSITDTFHSRAAPRGELRQSHTWTVTGTIHLHVVTPIRE